MQLNLVRGQVGAHLRLREASTSQVLASRCGQPRADARSQRRAHVKVRFHHECELLSCQGIVRAHAWLPRRAADASGLSECTDGPLPQARRAACMVRAAVAEKASAGGPSQFKQPAGKGLGFYTGEDGYLYCDNMRVEDVRKQVRPEWAPAAIWQLHAAPPSSLPSSSCTPQLPAGPQQLQSRRHC